MQGVLEIKTPELHDIAVKLYDEGYTDLVMIVGSDDKEFQHYLTHIMVSRVNDMVSIN